MHESMHQDTSQMHVIPTPILSQINGKQIVSKLPIFLYKMHRVNLKSPIMNPIKTEKAQFPRIFARNCGLLCCNEKVSISFLYKCLNTVIGSKFCNIFPFVYMDLIKMLNSCLQSLEGALSASVTTIVLSTYLL